MQSFSRKKNALTETLKPPKPLLKTLQLFFKDLQSGLKMKKKDSKRKVFALLMFAILLFFSASVGTAQTESNDVLVMKELAKSLNADKNLGWTSPDPCAWAHVTCSLNRVTGIQVGGLNLIGTLPSSLKNLTALTKLEFQNNQISGHLPSLSGLNHLQSLLLHNNLFTSIPSDFFINLTALQAVYLDNNPYSPWTIPASLKDAETMMNFSANNASVTGTIPDFFGTDFPSLITLQLSYNNLTGGLPSSLAGSSIQVLWLNNQVQPMLSGTIQVVQNMTELVELWLNVNSFTGPLPDFSGLKSLQNLNLRDNQFTGLVPSSLTSLSSLRNVSLTNNYFQGPFPTFDKSVTADNSGSNRFCLPSPGNCDSRVMALLSIVKSMNFPVVLAIEWKGNDPCNQWAYVSCNQGNITVVNFKSLGLSGTISPDFSQLQSLQSLILANNNLTGSIPSELTNLPQLKRLDVTNNSLSGKVPAFRQNVLVVTDGNPNIGKDIGSPPSSTPSSPSAPSPVNGNETTDSRNHTADQSSVPVGVIVGPVVGCVCAVLLLAMLGLYCYKRKQHPFGRVQSPHTTVIHPRYSASDPEMVKITVAGSSVTGGTASETFSRTSSGPSDIHVVEAGSMVISIQVLRNVTNNFSEENVLGRGGFGTVYKGELHDGTKIAVKRMEAGVMSGKGLNEFQSEIAVLTKVRHRHLVSLIGYCLDGNEKLLVYEYMPQGPLSHHLFNWKENGLKPLEWKKRLSIALDVARGVEYLHNLAGQSFIHRDLKPSNILLGDDMRAKVADFGLVRLAPDGKCSIETRLAGTFGYLAPEYAVTGRVTTKADVFSFGVILMEMITGRRALDETQPEESMHLVTWFRRMQTNKEAFKKAIDPTMDLEPIEDTLASISTVAELAGHCTAREPYQRPDMGHTVNVLSPLVEQWKPSDPNAEDCYGIDLDMTLPQALKKWQAFECNSQMDSRSASFIASMDSTQTSIPTRPSGFADSFTSADGR